MNGYLVVISGTMDELPVRLCESESFAREWATACDPEKEADVVAEQRGIDIAGRLICIRLQKFVDGAPVSDEVVRDLEAEDEAEGGAE
ncbi:MAG: hypothetical protein SFV23_12860 [Planctomycetaceae bacterium]|nr:hypothetical protein [Planctomycetaceae bacterium]